MPRLSINEIAAILAAAGNVDIGAMAEDCATAREGDKFISAYERGMEKLRVMLKARKTKRD